MPKQQPVWRAQAFSPLGLPLSARWRQIDGVPALIADVDSLQPTIIAPIRISLADCRMTFEVKVDDGTLVANTAADTVEVRCYIGGDADHDDQVTVFDVIDVVNAFGTAGGDPGFDPACDFDGSGGVDVFDVILTIYSFGRSL